MLRTFPILVLALLACTDKKQSTPNPAPLVQKDTIPTPPPPPPKSPAPAAHNENTAAPGSPGSAKCQPPGDFATCKSECQAGIQHSCAVLGLMGLQDKRPSNVARGVELLQSSCKENVALGCGGLASAHAQGLGVDKDFERGYELYKKACAGGDGLSCESLGGMHLMGKNLPKNEKVAAQWYEKACNLGRPAPCGFLAAFILDGVVASDRTPEQVVALLKKSCAGAVSTGCKILGDAYAQGNGVTQDPTHARNLYQKACKLGSKLGCAAAATKQ